ncbi:BnaA08g14420D [Brassica napus]|uniref:BnaA08g14420D protein n=1 Tax=Brassica napus TaxID=3708 RepID=A0A078FMG9_BRANA|nr:BnaA08g14420D [Brassica napus]
MATSYTLLADLRVGRCSKTAKVHLLRVWEARNINKGGELMSVDMLLIDENADREIVQRVESAKIEMYPMAVTTLLYSHGNAADIFQMYELTIQLRKWVLNDPYTLSTPYRKRCDDVCVCPSVLNAPFQIPTGYFMKICFSDFMYLFVGLIQYFCSFDVEKHILLSLKSTKVFPNVMFAFVEHNQQEIGIACVSPSLLSHKSACKEKPSTPPHPTDGRSSWWCLIYIVPLSDDYITHWKQQH